MTVKFHLLKIGDRIENHGDADSCNKYLDLFSKLNESDVKKAILFFNDEAIYFEKGEASVLVGTQKNTVGMAKFYARKLMESNKKRTKLSSLDEAFKLAEEIEKMDLEEFMKFTRG
jgi:hypothetical protein